MEKVITSRIIEELQEMETQIEEEWAGFRERLQNRIEAIKPSVIK